MHDGASGLDVEAMCRFVSGELAAQADPEKAAKMAAYMKTAMPFFGVQKPLRVPIFRELARRFAPDSQLAYGRAVRALWGLPQREEKYAALDYAARFKRFITPDSIPLYETLVREGGWWDLVDTVASTLIHPLMAGHPAVMQGLARSWIAPAAGSRPQLDRG